MAYRLVFAVVVLACVIAGSEAQPAWSTKIQKDGYCAMYGNCGITADGPVPCPANMPAQEITRGVAQRLAQFCPAAWRQIQEDGRVCCTEMQLDFLQYGPHVVDAPFMTCPACWENLKTIDCMIACSPNQSTFLNVTKAEDLFHSSQKNLLHTGVTQVDSKIHPDVLNALYSSCKDVTDGGSKKAMNNLGDPQNGLDFLSIRSRSVANGGHQPFQINVNGASTTDFESMKAPLVGCADYHYQCGCSDCPASCHALTAY